MTDEAEELGAGWGEPWSCPGAVWTPENQEPSEMLGASAGKIHEDGVPPAALFGAVCGGD